MHRRGGPGRSLYAQAIGLGRRRRSPGPAIGIAAPLHQGHGRALQRHSRQHRRRPDRRVRRVGRPCRRPHAPCTGRPRTVPPCGARGDATIAWCRRTVARLSCEVDALVPRRAHPSFCSHIPPRGDNGRPPRCHGRRRLARRAADRSTARRGRALQHSFISCTTPSPSLAPRGCGTRTGLAIGPRDLRAALRYGAPRGSWAGAAARPRRSRRRRRAR